jgi:ATP-dependent exoDNAse (exonuclease V) beta subunit
MRGKGVSIADAKERLEATDPKRSFIVQAPAGSGKTELLIQRFLALLGKVRRPDEVLAITFTRKAAGEMRSRIFQALESTQKPKPATEHGARTWHLAQNALDQDRKFGWRLLENPSLLTIQTIDSFAAGLVRRMPWVSRFGGVPEVDEDPHLLYRRACERTLARLENAGRGSEEIALLLAHLDNRMDLLRDLLVSMLQRRDQWLRLIVWKDHNKQRQILEKALGDLVVQALQRACLSIPEQLHDELVPLGRFAASNLSDAGERALLALADLERFPGTAVQDLPAWQGLADLLLTAGGTLRKKVDKNCGFPPDKNGVAAAMKKSMLKVLEELALYGEAETFLAEVRQLPPTFYPDDQWRILQALVNLLPLAVAELWLVFGEEKKTDFAEIALKAQQSLGENGQPSELLLKLDAKINHILVDEFQDTSHLQFCLLKNLTAGWVPGDGRTLFLVGDPMQSIYRFREAEVGLFLKARTQGIGSVALIPLNLFTNFRSQEGIVNWINATFADIFPHQEDEARGAVPYSPAGAIHAALPEAPVTFRLSAGRDDRGEAEQVVEIARQTLKNRPGDTVAVLVRSRTHLSDILRAFREAGFRYKAQDIDLLQNRPVARDILSLTRSLLHPADRLSWLSVLRGPWCGLTLADLHALCGTEPLRTVPELLEDACALSRLSEDGQKRVSRVGGILFAGMAQRGRVSLRRLVEGCWLALGGPTCIDAIEDAEMVFGLLERLDHGGDLQSLESFSEGLQKLFAAPDAQASGSLQVMTIHKAKGLEFDTVILPGLGRRPRQGGKPLLRWLEHPDSGLLLAPVAPRDGNSQDPIYDAIGRLEKDKEDLEVGRLLYVAATRAKKQLFLLGHAVPCQNGDCRPEAGSLLKKLWLVAKNEVQATLPNRNRDQSEEPSPSVSPLHRLPANWRIPRFVSVPVKCEAAIQRPSTDKGVDIRQTAFTGWEAEKARHVGTVSHAFLERMAREGLEKWPESRLPELGAAVQRRLSALGVPAAELPQCIQKVLFALKQTLGSERGRWIVGPRKKAACELALSGIIDGKLVHAVIDRTFIDEDGTRWVIDYKTSDCQEEEKEEFLQKEAERYRAQLLAYAALFKHLEPDRKIRTALYFPLVDGWFEVPMGL